MLLDLFDRVVIPICTYNSEVWGSPLFTQKFAPTVFLFKKQLNNSLDILHCSFLKQILGINSMVANWAVLNETNRH